MGQEEAAALGGFRAAGGGAGLKDAEGFSSPRWEDIPQLCDCWARARRGEGACPGDGE